MSTVPLLVQQLECGVVDFVVGRVDFCNPSFVFALRRHRNRRLSSVQVITQSGRWPLHRFCEAIESLNTRKLSLWHIKSWCGSIIRALDSLLQKQCLEELEFFECKVVPDELHDALRRASFLKKVLFRCSVYSAPRQLLPNYDCVLSMSNSDQVSENLVPFVTTLITSSDCSHVLPRFTESNTLHLRHLYIHSCNGHILTEFARSIKTIEHLAATGPCFDELEEAFSSYPHLTSLELGLSPGQSSADKLCALLTSNPNITSFRLSNADFDVSPCFALLQSVQSLSLSALCFSADALISLFCCTKRLVKLNLLWPKIDADSLSSVLAAVPTAILVEFMLYMSAESPQVRHSEAIRIVNASPNLRSITWSAIHDASNDELAQFCEACANNLSVTFARFVAGSSKLTDEMMLQVRSDIQWFDSNPRGTVNHRNACCRGLARRAVLAFVAVRKFRQSVISRLPRDVVTLLAKALFLTRGDYKSWWKTGERFDSHPMSAITMTSSN